jgi:hypothetical protein
VVKRVMRVDARFHGASILFMIQITQGLRIQMIEAFFCDRIHKIDRINMSAEILYHANLARMAKQCPKTQVSRHVTERLEV